MNALQLNVKTLDFIKGGAKII